MPAGGASSVSRQGGAGRVWLALTCIGVLAAVPAGVPAGGADSARWNYFRFFSIDKSFQQGCWQGCSNCLSAAAN